jgi:hypothetical protein
MELSSSVNLISHAFGVASRISRINGKHAPFLLCGTTELVTCSENDTEKVDSQEREG